MLKIGMSLLVCDSSINFIFTHVLYYSDKVDHIVCIANKPSKILIYILNLLQKKFENFQFLETSSDVMTIAIQQKLCTKMSLCLKDKGCDWIIPCDDDEFYLGNIREEIDKADASGFNVLYQNGFCFYTTWDSEKIDLNPVRNMRYRDPDTVDYNFRKAIHKASDFISTLSGNHWVNLSCPVKQTKSQNLIIYHYHYRYRKTFADNEINGCWSILNESQILEKKLVFDDTLIHILDEKGIP